MPETANIPNTKPCPKCGFENDANYKFCMKCGTPLASEPTAAPKAESAGFAQTSQPKQHDSSAPEQSARRVPKGLEKGRNRAKRPMPNIPQQAQANQQGAREVPAFGSSANNQQPKTQPLPENQPKPATQAMPEAQPTPKAQAMPEIEPIPEARPAFNEAGQNNGVAFGSTQPGGSTQTDAFKQAQNNPAQANAEKPKSVKEMFKEQQNKQQTQGFASTQRGAPRKSRKRSPVSFKGIIEPVEVDTSHVEEVFAKGLPEWDVTPPFIVVRRKKK